MPAFGPLALYLPLEFLSDCTDYMLFRLACLLLSSFRFEFALGLKATVWALGSFRSLCIWDLAVEPRLMVPCGVKSCFWK